MDDLNGKCVHGLINKYCYLCNQLRIEKETNDTNNINKSGEGIQIKTEQSNNEGNS